MRSLLALACVLAETRVKLTAADGAWLEWMPQGAILFDGAQISRAIDIDIDGSARLLAGELLFFGRRAMGERFANGFADERWSVRRAGRLVWQDRLRVDGEDRIVDPFGFDDAAAYATLVYAGDDATDALSWARPAAGESSPDLRIGLTAFDGLLICRMFGRDGAAVRERLGLLWSAWRHRFGGQAARMPRLWEI